jgi:hypothetical protein
METHERRIVTAYSLPPSLIEAVKVLADRGHGGNRSAAAEEIMARGLSTEGAFTLPTEATRAA